MSIRVERIAGVFGGMVATLVATIVVGCFSEATPTQACRDGDPGCDCRSDGTCDPGLVCESSVTKCIAEDCNAGAENCLCTADGLCLQTLTCQEGVCRPPAGTETGVATFDETTAASATGSATTATSSTTGDTASPSTGIVDPGSTGGFETGVMAESSTGAAEPACRDCFYGAMETPCGPQWSTCSENVECDQLRSCQLDDGLPTGQCCGDHAAGQADWDAIVECMLTGTFCNQGCVPHDLACTQ